MRSRELTLRGVDIFQKATTADGADRSGLAHLTYATMANYATDAALVVALANTLFLVDPKQGVWRVLLYLVITVAPFAFIAPVIGPMLDRLQTGRRLALAASMVGRGVLALLMIFTFTGTDASWALYPCALGSLVFSKSFGVLKASLTPRVLPEAITLVKTNSRLTVFGLIAGGAAGAIAAALTWAFGSAGALVFTAAIGFAGAALCLRIPAWVESTEGEIPVHGATRLPRSGPAVVSESVRTTLWANSVIRIETGFLAMFIAFVVMKEYDDRTGIVKLLLLGIVGAAAGVGGFLGNALGAKLTLRSPEVISLWGGLATLTMTVVAAFLPGLMTAALVGLVGSTASSLAKVCLDSVIQRDLPEESRASAFGRSETALQLAWVFGGVVGLLLGGLLNLAHDTIYTIGFVTVSLLLILGLIQTWMVKGGRTMVPALTMPWRRRKSSTAGTVRSGQGGSTGTSVTESANLGYAPDSEATRLVETGSERTTVHRTTQTPAASPGRNGKNTKRSGGARRLPTRAKDRRSGEPLE
ncbi:MFS transporter [Nakamurella silvestris]|nr:MFS transporter [Nakamurella silvestris]